MQISINNIYIIYEDSLDRLSSMEDLTTFNLVLHLKQFKWQNDELTKYTNKEGIFKNFMNISSFLQRSGTWTISDMAYWAITLESFGISFSVKNPLFITDVSQNQQLSRTRAGEVMQKFKNALEANKASNPFDVFNLTKLSFDIIIFYKETSKIPIHAVFFYFDFEGIESNIEVIRMAVLFDILNYFQTILQSRDIDIIKPKFPYLTKQRLEYVTQRLKLNIDQKESLIPIQRIIIRDYLD